MRAQRLLLDCSSGYLMITHHYVECICEWNNRWLNNKFHHSILETVRRNEPETTATSTIEDDEQRHPTPRRQQHHLQQQTHQKRRAKGKQTNKTLRNCVLTLIVPTVVQALTSKFRFVDIVVVVIVVVLVVFYVFSC